MFLLDVAPEGEPHICKVIKSASGKAVRRAPLPGGEGVSFGGGFSVAHCVNIGK